MSSNVKYIGLDLHKEAIAIAVLNDAGKLVMESIIETKGGPRSDKRNYGTISETPQLFQKTYAICIPYS
jgi:hypothetical protein